MCRSFLQPYVAKENIANSLNYKQDNYQFYSRFNQGVCTISLPDVAFSSKGNFEKFWQIFDERLELCHRALQIRHNRLLGKSSDMAPILWQNGAFARLAPEEKIDKLLFNDYSSISLGYGGLYECVKYMTGHSHTDGNGGKAFAIQIMQHMNDMCKKWKAEENIGYSVYSTPMESTTYKFAKCLKARFGNDIFEKLDGEDRNYITNSYHVPVFENIDAFDKLALEAEFQKLATGGAISYIEAPNLQKNVEVVETVIKYIYDTIMYAELNLKLDTCLKCNFEGEMPMTELPGKKYKWTCPVCGNDDPTYMINTRRTCGYLGSFGYNDGRLGDIHDRVLHLDNKEAE